MTRKTTVFKHILLPMIEPGLKDLKKNKQTKKNNKFTFYAIIKFTGDIYHKSNYKTRKNAK